MGPVRIGFSIQENVGTDTTGDTNGLDIALTGTSGSVLGGALIITGVAGGVEGDFVILPDATAFTDPVAGAWQITSSPEPSTLLLISAGLVLVRVRRRATRNRTDS